MKTSMPMIRLVATFAIVLLPLTALALQTERAFTPVTRFNVAGQPTGTIAPDPDGGGPLRYLATRNTYDSRGFLSKVERGELGAWLDESIAPENWGSSSSFMIRSTTEFAYDSHGRKSVELVRGMDGAIESLQQFGYGSDNRLACVAVRMNPALFATPPPDACALGSPGPFGPDRITRFTYDHLGQLGREDRAVGVAGLQQAYVTNTYNHRQLRAQTDANGNRTELRYDSYGRLWRRVYPHPSATGSVNESDYEEYTYYANGNVRTERKRDGTSIYYAYDALNRPSSKDFSDPSMQDIHYDFDLRGLQLHSRFGGDSGRGESNRYNGFGELTVRETTAGGKYRAISYRYDPNGNRTRVSHPDGYFFEYAFDGMNRVTGVSSSTGAAPDSPVVSLLSVVYARDGGRDSIVRPNGMTTSYQRDNAGRLGSFRQTFPAAADSLENVFRYNPAGQVRHLTQGNNQYNFREVANRTGAYIPNGLNQYQSINGNAVGYDTKGNLTSDGGATYRYDMENRLVETRGAKASTLSYDTLGRLSQITVDNRTTEYLYDGDALIAEYVFGGVTRRYVHGDQVDEPWVQFNGNAVASSDRRYLFADHQGSVIAQASSSGAVLSKNSYDPYGIPAATNTDRFGYTGQTWLKELGLNYYKARVYSPRLGRFLQTDPIGYGDDLNLYAYVGADPLNANDPSGTCAWDGCALEGIATGTVVKIVVGVVATIAVGAAMKEFSDRVRDHAIANAQNSAGDSDVETPPSDAGDGDGKKNPPNPNGSKGGEAHQGKIKERIRTLKEEGHTHVAGGDKPEETVKTPGGTKQSRRPDITTRGPNGEPYRENIGRQNQNQTPVSRERKAQEDIKNATGQCAFVPYNCK